LKVIILIIAGGLGNISQARSCMATNLDWLATGGVVVGKRILTEPLRLGRIPTGSRSNGAVFNPPRTAGMRMP
jgi:hypothetical protein